MNGTTDLLAFLSARERVFLWNESAPESSDAVRAVNRLENAPAFVTIVGMQTVESWIPSNGINYELFCCA